MKRIREDWLRFGPGLTALLGLTIGLACWVDALRASDTQWWITNQAQDLALSQSRGVLVGSDGVLRLGPRTEVWAAESTDVVWSIAPLSDGSVALGGEDGRIERWTASGGLKPWVQLPVGQVLSLAADGGALLAGTAPDGVIYRVGAKGDTSVLARTGERYVWGLASGGRGVWYAATGTRGRLYRIEDGKARLVLDSDESNLVSILADGHGGVYLGGDSKGRVIHVSANGTARTMFDAPEEEIRALAIGADGALYAAALNSSAVEAGSSGTVTLATALGGPASRPDPEDDDPRRMQPSLQRTQTGRVTLYRIVPDSTVTTWWSCGESALFALLADGRDVLAATGNRAGLYRVTGAEDAGAAFLPPQGQLTSLISQGGAIFAAASNPAALWRLGPASADRGELLSPPFDAKRLARFGHARWRGEGGKIGLAVRSGNSPTPDTTWSAWSGGDAGAEGIAIQAPVGRFAQWKVSLAKSDQRVTSVEVSWREVNQPPHIDALDVAPQGVGFREGELQPRSEPVTQVLPDGRKAEYSSTPPKTARDLRALPMWARGLRTIHWKVSDPNGDDLLFKLERRAEGANDWILMTDKADDNAFTWDTNSLPDGRYRLRLTATDAPSNAVGEELTAVEVTAAFLIDNTPPRVTSLSAVGEHGAVRVEAEAEDEGGILSEIDVAIDEEDWRPVTPDGGLTDTPHAKLHAWLPNIAPGEHTIGVRAVDLAGNSVTRGMRVTVPREH
ncbi:MAG: hypothetical protein ACRENS_03675 [Candidatus Eiseniibacteriota bacterium]